MPIELLHGLLAVVFLMIWLLTWQIIVRAQRSERQRGEDSEGPPRQSSTRR
jgi:hypothetical protein